jgi:carbon-monoxide dehydrogenase large subunit
VPATSHPLGFRPGSEGGTTPALGVVMNAILDALSEFGVTHLEMPATAPRIWDAIQNARQRKSAVKKDETMKLRQPTSLEEQVQ